MVWKNWNQMFLLLNAKLFITLLFFETVVVCWIKKHVRKIVTVKANKSISQNDVRCSISENDVAVNILQKETNL